MSIAIPATVRAWQYSNVKGGLEKNLKLNTVPTPKPKDNQHLVEIIAVALNPVDYKPAELINKFYPHAATPGLDFVGRIAKPAAGTPFKIGDLVFGVAGTGSPVAGGALSEFAIVADKQAVLVPDGVNPIDASTLGVAGLTAYQSIVPRVKKGDKIFINGGSGGTGCFGIQFAKAVGCHVTTTCSTPNVELCKSLGADEVIDYKKESVVETLIASGVKYDHAVDNVGKDTKILWSAHKFLKPDAAMVVVGGEASVSGATDMLKRKLIPGFLGGIKGKIEGFWPSQKPADLAQAAEWIKEGKVKAIVDTKFSFEQAPEAFTRLKTGRARGKIVIEVASEKA